MTVGEKIKLLRENRKLSIEEVSKDSQINAKKLKRIERNSYIPSREEVQKLCDVFEVEEKEIINEETRKDTTKYDALLSLNNLVFWFLNVVVSLFYAIVAFLPALKAYTKDGTLIVYSFNSLLMEENNPLVIISFVLAIIGLLLASALIINRFSGKVYLNEKQIFIANIILLILLVFVVATIFVVVGVFASKFVVLSY